MINSLIVSALRCTAATVAHYYHTTKASVGVEPEFQATDWDTKPSCWDLGSSDYDQNDNVFMDEKF